MLNIRKYLEGGRGRCLSTCRWVTRRLNTLYESIICKKDSIILNSWVEYRFGHLLQRNWGDELNIYLVERLIHKKVSNRSDIFKNKTTNYTVIGSLIPESINEYTVIWGSGASHCKDAEFLSIPKKVCAVRGKLTRDLLLANGIECPEIYGDPALLLPMIYPKERCKKYRLGIICHMDDEGHADYKEFIKNNSTEVIQISLHNYGEWKSVIDKICSCEVIASSSLHGLIVADAYCVPNVWLKSHVRLHGDEFKFMDYFSGVNRTPPIPLLLNKESSIDDIVANASSDIPLNFDIMPLIEACPFKINCL